MAEPTDTLIGRLELNPVLAGVPHAEIIALVCRGALKHYRKDEVVFREGEYGFEFYVMQRGSVLVVKTTAQGGDAVIDAIGCDGFFGEMGPLLGAPRSATIVAAEESAILEIREEDFHDLVDRVPSFKARMDAAYLERALGSCLALVPLLQPLTGEERALLAAEAELVTLEKGEVVFAEGEPADAFYIVRRGFVKLTRRVDGRPKTLAYLRENGSFGEMGLIERRARQATVTALGRVELIRFEAATFDALFEHHPDVRARITEMVSARRAASSEHGEGWAVLVEQGLVQLTEVLAVDLHACTRCGVCEERCASVHGGSPRLVLKGFRAGNLLIPASCHMCADPECMKACRFAAITRDRSGAVRFRDHCTGCLRCAAACPYGVITASERPAEPRHAKRRRVAVKCDGCEGLGALACVVDCPTGALARIDPRLLLS